MDDAVERLAAVRTDIATAAADCERPADDVTLVAVSKTMVAEIIQPVLAAGQRVFGENRVQEAKAKWPGLKADYPGVELHLIGPLQSNKVKEAVGLFDVIETVDRESLVAELVKELPKEMARSGRIPKLLVQINTGDEPQKAGVSPQDADAFIQSCQARGLVIEGLMCIPPADEPPSPHFAMLAKIAARHGLKILSMGMSADYREAIQLGATHVRVGSAIFGARPPGREHG
ncbi:YggS family pyridoxal phosphate-dependent enzyme [Rhizobiales bacterium TNE-4]|nr:YggS family pyridoxal phosphate-dependent enzyme [Rhizobiales bacterium TNE-4]MBV1828355.1 YggS family pyridoxal phosphate-dependent enzyme [Rhizobiales bacterium TNE-4]